MRISYISNFTLNGLISNIANVTLNDQNINKDVLTLIVRVCHIFLLKQNMHLNILSQNSNNLFVFPTKTLM